jgi:hypothetical protein
MVHISFWFMLMMFTYSAEAHLRQESTEALVVACKEIGLEVNAEKTKYMVMSGDQNEGRSHNMETDNSSFERVEQFKNLRITLKNQNSMQEEI